MDNFIFGMIIGAELALMLVNTILALIDLRINKKVKGD